MQVATKVHKILRKYVVLTWKHDNKGLMQHVTSWNNMCANIWHHSEDIKATLCQPFNSELVKEFGTIYILVFYIL